MSTAPLCLVVDDSRVIRRLATDILKSLGLRTAEAEHGLAAVEYCRSQIPAMVLLDWNMPEMTGIEFVQAVRKDARYDGMQIVMVTSENEMANVAAALEAGANEYLMKPFTKEALEEKIALLGLSA